MLADRRHGWGARLSYLFATLIALLLPAASDAFSLHSARRLVTPWVSPSLHAPAPQGINVEKDQNPDHMLAFSGVPGLAHLRASAVSVPAGRDAACLRPTMSLRPTARDPQGQVDQARAALWPQAASHRRILRPGRAGQGAPNGALCVRGQAADAIAQDADSLSAVGPVASGWGKMVGFEEEALLPEDPNLVRGALPNGLRYSILKNKVPPKRFYVNLAVHAGSIDETDDQQGLAHFLEHMLFLGSEQYPHPQDIKNVLAKLGMSQLADANAYTDFRSTVYTLSAPTYGTCDARPDSNNAFGARKDTLFRAGLVEAPTTIMTTYSPEEEEEEEEEEEDWEEGEGEGQEAETASGEGKGGDNLELVLGLLHQMTFKALIREADVESERFAVLNEMRDSSDIDDRVATKYYEHLFNETLLPRRFPIGKEKIVREASAADLRRFYDTHYHPSNMHIFVVGDIDPEQILRLIHKIYAPEPSEPRAGGVLAPPESRLTPDGEMHTWPARGQRLVHEFGKAPVPEYAEVRHSQLTSFFLSMTFKEALESNSRYRHMFEEMLDSVIGMALDSRAQELRSRMGDPPFLGVDWSYLNSPREGCVLNSLTVHGEAGKWNSAVSAAVGIISGIVKYGLVQTELDRLVKTLMRQFELSAEQEGTDESDDVMARVQECAEAGDAFMTPTQRLDIFRQLVPAMSLDVVNRRAEQLYGFACTAGRSSGLRHHFVCGPSEHSADDNFDAVDAQRLCAVLEAASDGAVPYSDDVAMPEFLCCEEEMDALERARPPAFVAVSDEVAAQACVERSEGGALVVSKELGMTMRRLGNGVRVVYKKTPYEKKQVNIELHFLGGRASEGHVEGIKTAALPLALQVAMESGLGRHSYDAVVRYCQLHDLDYDMRSNFEGSLVSISASTTEATGLRRAFEIAHLIMSRPRIEDVALERLVRIIKVNWDSDYKNLETRVSRSMLELLVHPTTEKHADARFLPPTPADAEALTPDDMHHALTVEMTPDNLEVIVVGDFDEAELERCLLRYLGTLGPDARGMGAEEAGALGGAVGHVDGAGEAMQRVWEDEELYADMFHVHARQRPVRAKVNPNP
jgi:predicted Zn-dependent peptidase